MRLQGNKTKTLILDVSNELFYKNGYASTSFSDIENITGLSKGNITYHFKNKQSILEGIISNRLQDINILLESWEKESNKPQARLIMFCDMILNQKNNLEKFGCPMGTLTSEFSKNEPKLYEITLPLFKKFKEWLTQEYLNLKFTNKEAQQKAMSLLSRVQGIAVVTHAFKDISFLENEIKDLKSELLSL